MEIVAGLMVGFSAVSVVAHEVIVGAALALGPYGRAAMWLVPSLVWIACGVVWTRNLRRAVNS